MESPELPPASVARKRRGASLTAGRVMFPVQPVAPERFTETGVTGWIVPSRSAALRLTVPTKPLITFPSKSAAETVMFTEALALTISLKPLN